MKRTFDWHAIRAAYERGVGPTEIASSLPESPSRQAIEKRAIKEGWEVARLPDSPGKSLSDPKAIVLSKIRTGSPKKLAALAAGISESTLYDWLKSDPSFRSLCEASRAAYLCTNIERIDSAADRDWRAAAYSLERAPETRDQYGQKQESGGLQIVLQIDRREGITIDGHATRSD